MNKKDTSKLPITIQELTTGKVELAEKILRSLPDWFGIESAIIDYLKDIDRFPTYFALDADCNAIGFICLKFHNSYTTEIHVMGIMPEWHGKGAGSSLMEYVETTAKAQGCNYLMVKTLGPARPDPSYELTRQFYMKVGFCPLEEFQSIWPENPCLIMVKKI